MIYKKLAHSSCFHGERNKKDIKYIVIHYTGNSGDTAKGNATFFSREQSGSRNGVGAHFFVDSKGIKYKSIPLNQVAWSVGGFFTQDNGAGKYYKKCTNTNSVSIELCNCTKDYTAKQAAAVKSVIKYIQKYCPNATTIIRHWDVNGKGCPAPMIGTNNKKWVAFKKDITPKVSNKKTTSTTTKKSTTKKSTTKKK